MGCGEFLSVSRRDRAEALERRKDSRVRMPILVRNSEASNLMSRWISNQYRHSNKSHEAPAPLSN